MIAHVAGVPAEELLLFAGSGGAVVGAVRVWLGARFGRRQRARVP
ncbi:MAG TPA: hypothetical protein VK279_05395 [Solirubrobacteraceae bacterium]|nr:hypothetical protein [Solirubrobacteraceae bacterium]